MYRYDSLSEPGKRKNNSATSPKGSVIDIPRSVASPRRSSTTEIELNLQSCAFLEAFLNLFIDCFLSLYVRIFELAPPSRTYDELVDDIVNYLVSR